MQHFTFSQVDVFSDDAFGGNPVAVVHDADPLDERTMRAIASWTNLSETTFLLSPTQPGADYRVRIFTPTGELPFAGHPTLGTAHAWLEAGGTPAGDDLVQECAAGLVTVRRGEALAFAAPPLVRSGPADDQTRTAVAKALRMSVDDLVAVEWVDNGPGWLGVRLADAASVLAVDVDVAAMGELEIGLVGAHAAEDVARHGCAVEVRALFGSVEDPVTGSLNAGLAQWLIGAGVLPDVYVAAQGTVLGRTGRVHIARRDGQVWVGGATRTLVSGHVAVPTARSVAG